MKNKIKGHKITNTLILGLYTSSFNVHQKPGQINTKKSLKVIPIPNLGVTMRWKNLLYWIVKFISRSKILLFVTTGQRKHPREVDQIKW